MNGCELLTCTASLAGLLYLYRLDGKISAIGRDLWVMNDVRLKKWMAETGWSSNDGEIDS